MHLEQIVLARLAAHSLTVLLAGCVPDEPFTTTRSLRLAELPTSSRPNLEYTFDCSMVSLSDQPHFKLADRNSMVERLRPNSIDNGVWRRPGGIATYERTL